MNDKDLLKRIERLEEKLEQYYSAITIALRPIPNKEQPFGAQKTGEAEITPITIGETVNNLIMIFSQLSANFDALHNHLQGGHGEWGTKINPDGTKRAATLHEGFIGLSEYIGASGKIIKPGRNH